VDAERLVFLDESGAQTNMVRLRGRCPVGERLVTKVPHGHWKTSTMISAIRLSGPFAPAVFNGPTDTDVFRAYVQQVLIKELQPGDVVVMDNLRPHKAAGIRQAIESVGARVLYLPPYSPDFNPIEAMWSKIKQYLRSVSPRNWDALCDAVGKGLDRVTVQDCLGFFDHCGYARQKSKTL
jgi:transposase